VGVDEVLWEITAESAGISADESSALSLRDRKYGFESR
jgi:hypothetical protein